MRKKYSENEEDVNDLLTFLYNISTASQPVFYAELE